MVDQLGNNEHGENLRLEHGDVLEVEGDVEQGQERIHRFKQNQLGDDRALELLLGSENDQVSVNFQHAAFSAKTGTHS